MTLRALLLVTLSVSVLAIALVAAVRWLEPGFAFAGFHLRTSEFARESWIQGASDRADVGSARRLPGT